MSDESEPGPSGVRVQRASSLWGPRERGAPASSRSLVGGPASLLRVCLPNLWAPAPAPSLTLTHEPPSPQDLVMTLGPPETPAKSPISTSSPKSLWPCTSTRSQVPGTQMGQLWGLCLHHYTRPVRPLTSRSQTQARVSLARASHTATPETQSPGSDTATEEKPTQVEDTGAHRVRSCGPALDRGANRKTGTLWAVFCNRRELRQ